MTALALPSFASAIEFLHVTGTGDGETRVACETATGECTLRGRSKRSRPIPDST